MDWQIVLNIVTVLIGGGGVVAWIKAHSEVRNANKSADIAALEQTIVAIKSSYQETLDDYSKRCNEYDDRIQYLETEFVKQAQQINDYRKRTNELEIELDKANHRIECLENQLTQKNLEIMELRQENLELRKKTERRFGLAEA